MAIRVFILFRFDAQFEFEIRYTKKILKLNVKRPKYGQTEFDRVPTQI
jgi:hypothetical protein